MQAQHQVLLDDCFQHGIPMPGQEARPPLGVGRLQEADRLESLLAQPMDLGDRQVDIPHGHDPQRDEAARIGGAPLVDMPVVVRLQHHEGQVLVTRFGKRTSVEPGHGREAHRGQDPVDVHVPHPLVHIKQPGRSSENAPGLKPHSSCGHPTVAHIPKGVEVASP